jgi:3-oxoadipate enol-lactonase
MTGQLDDFDGLRLPVAPLSPRRRFAADLQARVHRRLGLPEPAGHRRLPKAAGLEYEIGGLDGGDAVLLLHAGTATAYRPLLDEPALRDRYRLVRYHRRGYAGSDRFDGAVTIERHVEDALALLDHLAIERAHVVGHSGSGIIALQLALDAPEQVRSLVLEEPALGPSDPRVGRVLREAIGIAVDRYRAGDAVGAMEVWMREISPTWRTDLARTVPCGPQQTTDDAAAFFEDVPPTIEWSFDERAIARLSVPILYVLAENSRPGHRDSLRRLQQFAPQTESVVIPRTTHMLHTDRPDLVAVELAAFFARHTH